MRTALITGITGQDGSYLAEYLLRAGNYKVVGVYRRSSNSNFQRIAHLVGDPNLELVCGDITDYVSISNIIHKYWPDEIYNLAAQSHVGVSFDQPLYTLNATAMGCVNILEAIRYFSSNPNSRYRPRFYQAGSSEQFGDKFETRPDGTRYQNEDTPMNPQSSYGVAKLCAYHMTRLYRQYGLYTSVGLLYNHESPRRGENFVTRKITKYIGELVNLNVDESYKVDTALDKFYSLSPSALKLPGNEPLKLGNLDAYRDWGFAGDYVEAMVSMLQQEEGDDYVVSTDDTHSVREFLQRAFGIVGLNYEDFIVIDPQFVRPAEVPYLRGDSTKARNKLGWKPRHNFESLVNLMVRSDIERQW